MLAIRCCYECTSRHVGCHGTCQRYLDAKEQLEKEKAKMHQDMPVVIHQSDFEMLACMHKQRKSGKRR